MALKARRMKGLRIDETSGVDAPAHLAPGWMVLKSAAGPDPLDGLSDSEIEDVIKALEAEPKEERPVQASTLSPETVQRIIDEAVNPVTRMEKAAAALRAADPALSRPGAIVKACDEDPELARSYAEAQERAALREQETTVHKAAVDPAWASIEAIADDIQRAAPALNRAEAIVKAADLNPAAVPRLGDG